MGSAFRRVRGVNRLTLIRCGRPARRGRGNALQLGDELAAEAVATQPRRRSRAPPRSRRGRRRAARRSTAAPSPSGRGRGSRRRSRETREPLLGQLPVAAAVPVTPCRQTTGAPGRSPHSVTLSCTRAPACRTARRFELARARRRLGERADAVDHRPPRARLERAQQAREVARAAHRRPEQRPLAEVERPHGSSTSCRRSRRRRRARPPGAGSRATAARSSRPSRPRGRRRPCSFAHCRPSPPSV